MMITRSSPALASLLPSGLQDNKVILSLWPRNTCTCTGSSSDRSHTGFSIDRSHTRIALPTLVLAIVVSFGLHSAFMSALELSWRMNSNSPVGAAQILSTLSDGSNPHLAATNILSSWLHAIESYNVYSLKLLSSRVSNRSPVKVFQTRMPPESAAANQLPLEFHATSTSPSPLPR